MEKALFSLSGKTALVTGATNGIGAEIAYMLAEQHCNVSVVGRNSDRASEIVKRINDLGSKAFACVHDISDEKQCAAAANETAEFFGGIDIVVNCAGILTKSKIDEITREEWEAVLSTNLSGTFFMIQSTLPYLRKSSSGRIINISSNAGRMGGYENSQSYTASKGGIIAITMGIARQLAPEGITCNVVCPGTTDSVMGNMYSKEALDRLLGRIPMGRLASPRDTAAAVCFFASEEAGYITGAILDVNGGMYMG